MGEQILIVDDEKSILDLTAMVLRNRGFDVLTTSDAHSALDIIGEQCPPLVLMDYMMPGLNGLSALKQIRDTHPDTYVIMFTGKGSEKVAVELMKAGAADYILKPFSNQDLVERIENVLKLRRFEIANRELREERERLLQEIEAWNMELEKRVALKSKELEKAHNEILQGEKLAALGHLSAGMTHEVRNPLNSISLFAQVLKSEKDESERSRHCEKILNEVARIDDILVRLLDVNKAPLDKVKTVDIKAVIERVLAQFKDQVISQNVHVEFSAESNECYVRAKDEDLQHIFSNLFANSLQSITNGGDISIRLLEQDSQFKVEFEDNGQGILEKHLQKVFDPFFTTKPRGTGFGLSVVLRIVRNCGGQIWVDSTPGKGATFHILLPSDES